MVEAIRNYDKEELRTAILDADDKLSEMNMNYQSLLATIKPIKEDVKKCETKKQELENFNSGIQHKIQSLCEEITNLRKQNSELEENVKSLIHQLQSQESEQNLGCLEGDVLELLVPKSNKQRLMWTAVKRSLSCPSNQRYVMRLQRC